MIRNELTKPFILKSLSLPGRVVMAPMTRSRSPHNIPGPDDAQYYRRRAENNVSLIITEGTVVDPAGHAYPDVPNFSGKEALQGWKK
jgi:2,4-dienoyl-CoA reductase-like NADH-dependent reductase (Old Yellow Enzyme family)